MKAKVNFTEKLVSAGVGDRLFVIEGLGKDAKLKEAVEIIGKEETPAGVGFKMKFADWVNDEEKQQIIEAMQEAIKKEKK